MYNTAMTQTEFPFLSNITTCAVCRYSYVTVLVNWNRCGSCEENARKENFARMLR